MAYPLQPEDLQTEELPLLVIPSGETPAKILGLGNLEVTSVKEGDSMYEEALGMTAAVYHEMYADKEMLSPEEVREELGDDGFNGQAKLLVLTEDLPTGQKKLVSTVRLVFAKHGSLDKPIEVESLFSPINHGAMWPNHTEGAVSAEFGRFLVSPMYRENMASLIAYFYAKTCEILSAQNTKYLFAVMPPHVVRVLRIAGINYHELTDDAGSTFLEINQASDKVKHLKDKFPRYWDPERDSLLPRVYMLTDLVYSYPESYENHLRRLDSHQ